MPGTGLVDVSGMDANATRQPISRRGAGGGRADQDAVL
jgi:hypothetical protein